MAQPASLPALSPRLPRDLTARWLIALAVAVGVAGGVGLFTFRYAEGLSYFSTDPKACVNCHIMRPQYSAWLTSSHQVEQRNPYVRVVDVGENDTDPAKWGKNWPMEYDGYRRTALPTKTRYGGHGGSEALPEEKIARDPWLKRMFLGYAFSIDYRDRSAEHDQRRAARSDVERLGGHASGSDGAVPGAAAALGDHSSARRCGEARGHRQQRNAAARALPR